MMYWTWQFDIDQINLLPFIEIAHNVTSGTSRYNTISYKWVISIGWGSIFILAAFGRK